MKLMIEVEWEPGRLMSDPPDVAIDYANKALRHHAFRMASDVSKHQGTARVTKMAVEEED